MEGSSSIGSLSERFLKPRNRELEKSERENNKLLGLKPSKQTVHGCSTINTWRGVTPAIAITLRGLFFFLLVPREIDEAGHDSFPLPRPLIRHRNTVDTITITNDAFETSAQFGITSQGKRSFFFGCEENIKKPRRLLLHRLIINWRECTNHARPITFTVSRHINSPS
jgi:hypothetical protein